MEKHIKFTNPPHLTSAPTLLLAGREFVKNHKHCALCDMFLMFWQAVWYWPKVFKDRWLQFGVIPGEIPIPQ